VGAGVDASKRLLLAEATGAILTDVASSLAAEAQGASADRDDAMNASWARDAVLLESLVEGGPKAVLDVGGGVSEDVVDVGAVGAVAVAGSDRSTHGWITIVLPPWEIDCVGKAVAVAGSDRSWVWDDFVQSAVVVVGAGFVDAGVGGGLGDVTAEGIGNALEGDEGEGVAFADVVRDDFLMTEDPSYHVSVL
jgi:hypothetical protein